MKSIHLIAGLAVALTGLPAEAQVRSDKNLNGASGRPIINLRVCNSSGRSATVAVSYIQPGESRFINRGWYDVADGACEELVTTDNANFYFYADATDGSGRRWAGGHDLCVQYPGPYTFYTSGTECQSGQELRGFTPFNSTEPGSWTWTLNP
ncbi:MAG: DUF1036 domain-containing protein [Brevundimonas sp.]|nr:DUF1036 domain-containing protein [Brevundimonas sp.]